jgi:hypothetical protein
VSGENQPRADVADGGDADRPVDVVGVDDGETVTLDQFEAVGEVAEMDGHAGGKTLFHRAAAEEEELALVAE